MLIHGDTYRNNR